MKMMYIAFLLVYLISTKVTIYNETLNVKYKDLIDNNIEIDGYCDKKPCVVKCCDNGYVMNNIGVCNSNDRFDNYYDNYNFSVYHWNDVAKVINDSTKTLHRNMVFVRNDKYSNGSSDEFWTKDFSLLEDGSLIVKHYAMQWAHVSPLEFCVDYRLDAEGQVTEAAVVFSFDKIDIEKDDPLLHLAYFGAGILSSLVAIAVLVYRIPPRMRHTFATVLTMCAFAILAAYILKITQLSALSTGLDYFNDCRIMSPAIYFFVLSSFFWSNLSVYEVKWRMCCLRKKASTFYDKHSCLRLVCYHLYGFGIPLLMTAAAVAVDELDLYKTWPIEKSPFDSCFANETKTMLYLHLPIAILIISNCILFLRFFYFTLAYRKYILELIEKKPQLKNIKAVTLFTTKHRYIFIRKIFIIIAITCIMESVDDVPIVLYLALHLYNVCTLTTLLILVVFKKSLFTTPSERSNESNDVDNKFQAMQYLKKVKAKAICATLFSWNNNSNSEDKKKLLIWTTDVV